MSRFAAHLLCATVAGLVAAASAQAQLLGGSGLSAQSLGLPTQVPAPNLPVAGPLLRNVLSSPQAQQVVRPTLNSVAGLPEQIAQSGPSSLLELRRLRLEELVRDNRTQLEAGEDGLPVRRGIIVLLDPDTPSVQRLLFAGFRVAGQDGGPQLGMRVVELAVPAGMSARAGLKLVRKLTPLLQADFDPVYEPAGAALAPVAAALAASSGAGGGRVIGMIDGGVAAHPALAGKSLEQNGFAGPPQPTGHGTAVASLLVGSEGAFRGAATGALLFVADVYGGNRAAGSATAIVKALDWLAGHRPQVINISLVGPASAIVGQAIRLVQSRGIQVVAAVGNDGPAAPPQYPASYPGVVAVTGVDARGRALVEAGRASHLDFAAPGADMAAAFPGRGYATVRGTSFASPLAAARLLAAGSPARLVGEARPGKGKVGRGIVCGECRIDPRSVGAK